MKTGIFYGSTNGNTADAAQKFKNRSMPSVMMWVN